MYTSSLLFEDCLRLDQIKQTNKQTKTNKQTNKQTQNHHQTNNKNTNIFVRGLVGDQCNTDSFT